MYRRLGVEPIVNAFGTNTGLGGSVIDPEVLDAMADAGRVMVSMTELGGRAGDVIARHTGAEAGLVTAGAAAGMMLQAAACIAGDDARRIGNLPDTAGMNNEIVLKRDHRNEFVRVWRQAGAKLVPAGSSRPDIEAAITDKTAALAFVASRWHPDSFDGLDEMVLIARTHSLPVIVDAAAMLPPPENLRSFVQHGADMVAFSGGKAIRGPQSAGILCGRRDLIEAARLNASPNDNIGRPAKVCKEEIVGLIVALERYVARDHAADQSRWRLQCQTVVDALAQIPGVTPSVEHDDWTRPVPEVSVRLDSRWEGPSAEEVKRTLASGEPPIMIGADLRPGEDLFVNPHGLAPGEAELVAERLMQALRSKS